MAIILVPQPNPFRDSLRSSQHYHSYHLYSIFEQLHSPGVSGRPGSARTNYLRKCEEEQTAPLPIFDHIRQTPSGLVDMKLSRYGIGDHATVAFGEFLKHCPLKVNSLEVAHNSIMNRGMTILLRSISAHQLIKFLDISSNSPKRSSIVALTDLFLQPEPIRLVDLRLSNCNIGDRNMMILAEGIGESSTLETLKLDKNNLTMCGRDIAYILHENDILTDLDLSWNQFRNEEAAIIARCLIGNETMTSLDLSYNHFGFDSAIFSISKVRSSKERSDELTTFAMGTKTAHTHTFAQPPTSSATDVIILTIIPTHFAIRFAHRSLSPTLK